MADANQNSQRVRGTGPGSTEATWLVTERIGGEGRGQPLVDRAV